MNSPKATGTPTQPMFGLKRSKTTKIPSTWDLEGNHRKDPIAASLMVRIKGGCLAGIVEVPDYHTLKTFVPHETDVTQPFVNFMDPTATKKQHHKRPSMPTIRAEIPESWELDGNIRRDPIA